MKNIILLLILVLVGISSCQEEKKEPKQQQVFDMTPIAPQKKICEYCGNWADPFDFDHTDGLCAKRKRH